MPKRRCSNWLESLAQYVEETESPRQFWFWSGLSTIAGALQRKVWLPFGLEPLYANLYVMIVAPPGVCRKGAPVSLSKKLLQAVKAKVFADSPTKRALTKALSELGKTEYFTIIRPDGTKKPKVHCSMSLISKEFSSFLAVDPKAMVEILTDLFDAHDEWEYKTSGEGTDMLHGVCINCLFASTPSWIANNLPEDAIGGGFTSRFAIISGRKKYKWISLPPEPDAELFNRLVADLHQIKSLVGEFQWGKGAYECYNKWYHTVEDITANTRDMRLHGYIARMHVMVLKVAMCLHVAYSDTLVLEEKDVYQATILMQSVLDLAPDALGGQGRSRSSAETETIMKQLQTLGTTSFAELLKMNFRNTNKLELQEIMETILAMGAVKQDFDKSGRPQYTWVGLDAKGKGGKPNSRTTRRAKTFPPLNDSETEKS